MAALTLPIDILRGIYLGLLAGILPAMVAFGFGFLFRYVTGLSIPAFGVVVLGVALAGVNGGLMAFTDTSITQNTNSTVLITALVVVLLLALYAHGIGDHLGATLPRRLSLSTLREQTLNTDVVELVGARGQVRPRVVGQVRDMEGYPPLPASVRETVRSVDWTFPADLALSDLEDRFEDRLRSEFDLQEVDVTIDDQARASVVAAPPASGVSRRVPSGKRAVSVDALVPTGVARGDEVILFTTDGPVEGTVVSAKTGEKPKPTETAKQGNASSDGVATTDGGTDAESTPAPAPLAPTTAGGFGRVTVAVDRPQAELLLGATDVTIVVTARGTRREYELVALLRRTGQRMRRVTIRADGPLDGTTIGEADVREAYGVAILAVRHDDEWHVAPRGGASLAGGDELFVAGTRSDLAAFQGAVA